MKRLKYYFGSLLVMAIVISGNLILTNSSTAGVLNRKGTWKKVHQESMAGTVLTTYDHCKWSIWKSECSSANGGETKNKEVYRLL